MVVRRKAFSSLLSSLIVLAFFISQIGPFYPGRLLNQLTGYENPSLLVYSCLSSKPPTYIRLITFL